MAVDLFPAGEGPLEVERADHVTQRGHGELLDSLQEVGDLIGGAYRIGNLEIEHAVDRYHEVVRGDYGLWCEAHHLLPHVHLGPHGVDEGHDEVETRTQGALVLTEAFHHVHPLLRHDPHRPHQRDEREERYCPDQRDRQFHGYAFLVQLVTLGSLGPPRLARHP